MKARIVALLFAVSSTESFSAETWFLKRPYYPLDATCRLFDENKQNARVDEPTLQEAFWMVRQNPHCFATQSIIYVSPEELSNELAKKQSEVDLLKNQLSQLAKSVDALNKRLEELEGQ